MLRLSNLSNSPPHLHPLLPVLLAPCHLPSNPDPFPLFPLQKREAGLQEMTARQDITRCSKTVWKPPVEAGQGNPKGGEESREQAKELEVHPLPLLGSRSSCFSEGFPDVPGERPDGDLHFRLCMSLALGLCTHF